MSARFGPGRQRESFPSPQVLPGRTGWIAQQGLDCYEYQCGKGVHVGEDTARKLGEKAREAGIALSVHAPYFINLANPDPESRTKTTNYVLESCFVAQVMGAERIVIHSGALMKRSVGRRWTSPRRL